VTFESHMRITADHAMEPSALGLPLERRGSSLALVPISGAVSWQSPESIALSRRSEEIRGEN